MPGILEPIGAGLTVALINKFIINNNWLWENILGCHAKSTGHVDDSGESLDETSSSGISAIDGVEVHAHI